MTAAIPIHSLSPLLRQMPHRPDFFIVGAAKCGTTSLYEYLREHPRIFMSPHKEPHYFARDFDLPSEWCVRDDRQYVRLFAKAGGAQRIGEASVWYIFSKSAPHELIDFSPESRIIIMLREPIDMMYSLHGQFLWNCNEDLVDFEQALAAQDDRRRGLRIPPKAHIPAGLQYTDVATFSSQVRRYYDVFGRDRVHVILFDDFVRNTAVEYGKVLDFLGVSTDFAPRFETVNAAKPIAPGLNRFLSRHPALRHTVRTLVPAGLLRRANYWLPYLVRTVKRPSRVDAALRQRLQPQFASEIEALEKLIDRDLSAWRE